MIGAPRTSFILKKYLEGKGHATRHMPVVRLQTERRRVLWDCGNGVDGRPGARADRAGTRSDESEPERLAKLSWDVQGVRLQRSRPDQCQQRKESAGRLDAFSGPDHARHPIDAS